MNIPQLQMPFFGDNTKNISNTGTNKIQNGSFNSSLALWTPNQFVFDSGTARYQFTTGCYRGIIEQDVALLANKKYKLTLKYRSLTNFDLVVSFLNPSDVLIVPEVITHCISNGLWQVMEYTVISPIAITATVNLECRSTGTDSNGDFGSDYGGEEYGTCDDTSNAETGFYLDDITMFEQTNVLRNCEPCDTVAIDSNKPIEFQVGIGTENDLLNLDFQENPFSKVTDINLGFTFNGSTTDLQETIFYVCGKIFRFRFWASDLPTVIIGNVYYITMNRFGFSSEIKERLFNALVANLDAVCDTVTTYTPGTPSSYNITQFPSEAYINNSNGYLASVTGVETNTIGSTNFIYNDNKICFDKYSNPSRFIIEPINLVATTEYKFTLGYTAFYADMSISLFVNDGTNDTEYILDYNVGNNSIDVIITAILTASTTLRIQIVDDGTHDNGFCINSLSLKNYDIVNYIQNINYLDCNGNTNSLEYLYLYSGDNVLIQIKEFPKDTTFKIILIDIDGNQYESVNMQSIDFNTLANCFRNKYLKLNWFTQCLFNGIDYLNLPFMNEVYVIGSIKEENHVVKERVNYINSSGGIDNIFSHSLDSKTYTIANYSNTLHKLISKAFEHKFIYVNDDRVKVDAGRYDIVKLKDGMSSGEIDLIIDGSELVSSCCN